MVSVCRRLDDESLQQIICHPPGLLVLGRACLKSECCSDVVQVVDKCAGCHMFPRPRSLARAWLTDHQSHTFVHQVDALLERGRPEERHAFLCQLIRVSVVQCVVNCSRQGYEVPCAVRILRIISYRKDMVHSVSLNSHTFALRKLTRISIALQYESSFPLPFLGFIIEHRISPPTKQ